MPAQLLAYSCPHCGKLMEVEPVAGDQVLTCPNLECQKPFRLEVPRAQPAPALIVPGDVNAHAAASGGPAVAQITPLADPELATVRPQMFRRYPLRFLFLMGLVVGGAATLVYALATSWTLVVFLGAALLAYGGVRMMVWWMRQHSTSLTVTTRRCILHNGMLSPQTIEIAHAEVRDVLVTQTWRDRWFKIGDLTILGPEAAGLIIHVLGVPRAEEIASIVRSRRQV